MGAAAPRNMMIWRSPLETHRYAQTSEKVRIISGISRNLCRKVALHRVEVIVGGDRPETAQRVCGGAEWRTYLFKAHDLPLRVSAPRNRFYLGG